MKNAVNSTHRNGSMSFGSRQGKTVKGNKRMKSSSSKVGSSSSTLLILMRRQTHALLLWVSLVAAGLIAMPHAAFGASIPLNVTFELDGDVAATVPNPPDDWALLYNGGLDNGGSPSIYTGNVV